MIKFGPMPAIRVAYADPPYPGKAAKHYRRHPDYDGEVDYPALIARLVDEFPDGWALSCNSTNLRWLLPLCPDRVRVAAWVKPFATLKKGVNPTYAWEPVLFMGGRKRECTSAVHDWIRTGNVQNISFVGAKPEPFCFWLFQLLRLEPGDEFVDLFPGTGRVGQAWQKWQHQLWREPEPAEQRAYQT